MPRAKDYVWGIHLRKRLHERWPQLLKKEEWESVRTVNIAICKLIEKSSVQKAFLNNTRFMSYIYEEHGYDSYEFLLVPDLKLIFVVRGSEEGGKIIRTAMPTKPDLFEVKTKYKNKGERKSTLGKVKSKRNKKVLSESEAMLEYLEAQGLDIDNLI